MGRLNNSFFSFVFFVSVFFSISFLSGEILGQDNCYFNKKLKNVKYKTVNDSIQLLRVLSKSSKWYRFRSNKCNKSYTFLSEFLSSYHYADNLLDDSFIDVYCDLLSSKNFDEKEKNRVRDSILFNENILENSFFKENLARRIDSIRFAKAKNENTEISYYGYLFDCDYLNGSSYFKDEAEDSIFVIFNPSLYSTVRDFVKIIDLIRYIEDERNFTSHKYIIALEDLFRLYSFDGTIESIDKIIQNKQFVRYINECSDNDKKYLESIIIEEKRNAKEFSNLYNEIEVNKDSLSEYIKTNLPKQSAYVLIQQMIKPYIEKYDFFEASQIFNEFYQEDSDYYNLFPRMKNKMSKTIDLLDKSRYTRIIRKKIVEKSSVGYGVFEKVFPTDLGYLITIGGDRRNDVAIKDEEHVVSYHPKFSKIVDAKELKDTIEVIVIENGVINSIKSVNGSWEIFFRGSNTPNDVYIQKGIDIDYKKMGETDLTFTETDNVFYASILQESFDNKNWPKLSSFTEDRKGSLEIVEYDNNNKSIINIPILNARYHEINPFLDQDTLYFSSNSYYGFGGYDIYKSISINDKWSEPENIGYGYNSVNNDLSFRKENDDAVLICNAITGMENNATMAIKIGELDKNKPSFILEIVFPSSGISNSNEINAEYFDIYGNSEGSANFSYVDGDTAYIKINNNRYEGPYLRITKILPNGITSVNINLDSLHVFDIHPKDYKIPISKELDKLPWDNLPASIQNPIHSLDNIPGITYNSIHDDFLNLGNNKIIWNISAPGYAPTRLEVVINVYHPKIPDPTTIGEPTPIGPSNIYVEPPNPKITNFEEGDTLTIDLFYQTNKTDISEEELVKNFYGEDIPILKYIPESCAMYQDNREFDDYISIACYGYADERGSVAHNMFLSEIRAKTAQIFVNDYINDKVAPQLRDEAYSDKVYFYGETNQFDEIGNLKEENWRLNRRVVIKVLWRK